MSEPTTGPAASGRQSDSLPRSQVCRCGHERSAHEHYRTGSDCSFCECLRFRRVRGRKVTPPGGTTVPAANAADGEVHEAQSSSAGPALVAPSPHPLHPSPRRSWETSAPPPAAPLDGLAGSIIETSADSP